MEGGCRTARRDTAESVNYAIIRHGGVLPLLQILRSRFKQERT